MCLETNWKINAYPDLCGKYKRKAGVGKGQVQHMFKPDS